MKVLVIGGGGREHALVWKLRESPLVENIWCVPGNGGIAGEAECLSADVADPAGLAALAVRLGADLTVVGPEQPLVNGVVDEFAKKKRAIVGPNKIAAQLEGSKIFTKQFLQRHRIPTAEMYGAFDSPGDAYAALCAVDWPVVLKADGLCAGKGVFLAAEPDLVARWRTRLGEHGFRVGIVWQGNPSRREDRGRSIRLEHYLSLASVPDVRLISMQKDVGSEQLASGMMVETLGDDFDSGPDGFIDTAAVMMCPLSISSPSVGSEVMVTLPSVSGVASALSVNLKSATLKT